MNFLLVTALGALALVGCSAPSADDICERLGECPDADPDAVSTCKNKANDFADEAIADGCEEPLDAYFSCIYELDLCQEQATENGCLTEAAAIDDCRQPEGEDDPPAPG